MRWRETSLLSESATAAGGAGRAVRSVIAANAVHHLVDALDLYGLDARFRNDMRGSPDEVKRLFNSEAGQSGKEAAQWRSETVFQRCRLTGFHVEKPVPSGLCAATMLMRRNVIAPYVPEVDGKSLTT